MVAARTRTGRAPLPRGDGPAHRPAPPAGLRRRGLEPAGVLRALLALAGGGRCLVAPLGRGRA